jgi:predicted GNAT family acetyltransferase
MAGNVRDNTERHRFELETDGHIAFSNYERADGVLTGVGSALIRGVLDFARTQGLKVKTLCPFAKAYVDRHPEYADLRQPG